jgi:protein-disulfide isomerase
MTSRRPFAALLIALAITACSKKADEVTGGSTPVTSGPVAAVAAPAGKSWTDIVTATPEGGYRIGNPDAGIKLVEYGSFTCPHCKRFEDEAADPLKSKYIATGKVSWEFRSTVIHGGPDVAISLLMACRGPDPYFTLAQQLYATQETWFGEASIAKLNAALPATQSLPPAAQFKTIIETLGLYGFFAARGLPRAQADACLSDQKAVEALTANQQKYQTADNVTSTPAFFLNGQPQPDIENWTTLDQRLSALTR